MIGNTVGVPVRTRSVQVQGFYHERSKTISYVVYAERGGACAIIDSALDFDPAIQPHARG